jgi:beta-galactosidase/beta-glucuronidase
MKKFAILFISLICLGATAQKWSPAGDKIKTKWAEELTPENVWKEYPRPQLIRENWKNLNGMWNYSLLSKTVSKPRKYQGDILVPFCIESALSGVGKTMTKDHRLWYQREFQIPKTWADKNVILNFEAVDYSTTVWVNGAVVGSHKGAYDRFSFDITPYLRTKGKQVIVVSVDDPSSYGAQARGKQQVAQEGIWYTPVSGIWQTVWLEAVSSEAFLKEIKMVPDVDKKLVSIIPLTNQPLKFDYQVKISIFDEGKEVASTTVQADKKVDIALDNPKLWSPDNPFLYEVKLELKNKENKVVDEIDSYFGMRKISLGDLNGNKYLFLNNEPLFHYGTLDQGWWPDGLHTPPSDEAMKYDIEITKKMGFNMIRKHIKVEPDRWYYHCDKLGIMVWQDMPSGMVVLPGEGKKKLDYLQHVSRRGKDLHRRSSSSAQFEWELQRMIALHFNAPSIVMWVPFNEGWGQYDTDRIAKSIKAIDPSRLVNAVSGWALRPSGDIYDIHTYHTELRTPATSLDRASVIGEFGGIGYPVKGHQWNTNMRNWGYQTYQTAEELLKNYKYKFYQIVEMKKSKGLSAAVYTQTTDVEGEVNGLMTYDRKVIKIPVDTLKAMHEVLYKKGN